jgi:hypothetical protein
LRLRVRQQAVRKLDRQVRQYARAAERGHTRRTISGFRRELSYSHGDTLVSETLNPDCCDSYHRRAWRHVYGHGGDLIAQMNFMFGKL